jgi:hypothetical protein
VRDHWPVVQPRVFRAVDGSVAVADTTTRGMQCDLYELVRIGPELAELLGPRLFRAIPGEALHNEFRGMGWVEMCPCPPWMPQSVRPRREPWVTDLRRLPEI